MRFEVLDNYFEDCKKSGIEITNEMAEKEIESVLGMSAQELLEENLEDPEFQEINQSLANRVQEMMAQKTDDKTTTLNYLREKVFGSNLTKAAFVTAMLLLKFNPAHSANEHHKATDKKTDNTEHTIKKVDNQDGGDKKTFKVSAEQLNGHETKLVISATSNFETDKADLHDGAKLSADFDKFLSSINDHNFDKIIDKNWTVKGSSDERKTLNWHGSNEELTKARIDVFSKALQETLKNHDFSKQLSAENVQKILNKQITETYSAKGAEKGVTYLTDLVNQETGKKYTDSEVKTLKVSNPAEYQKLLDKCRYTNFEAESAMFEISDYDECFLFIDDSPSMQQSQKNMAEELRYVNADLPVTVAHFSMSVDGTVIPMKNSQEAAKGLSIMPTNGSSTELAFSAAIQFLQKIDVKANSNQDGKLTKKVMYIATDEGLQDVNNILDLQKIAAKTNTDVKILMFYDDGSKNVKLNLNDLVDRVKEVADAQIKVQRVQAENNLVAQKEAIIHRVESVINHLDDLYPYLVKDKVVNDHDWDKNVIRERLLSGKFDLSNLAKTPIGREFVNSLRYVQGATSSVYETSNKTFEKQVKEITRMTDFKDANGKDVKFPIDG